MSTRERSTKLYKTPFSLAYWRDAALELKDTKMLVFAALIVALRVALKTLIRIPLGPSLDITPAFLANALGAMVYGPVVGAIGALVSDVLGVMLRGDTYFLPYALTEISSSMLFGMFFYRQKITPTRVILSRFCICLFVNILLQTPIDMLFNYVMYGRTAMVLTLPRIFKNLFMFPIESVVMTIFLSAVQPITYRMKLTYDSAAKLSFSKRQIALLVLLVVVGIASVFGYLFVHYDNTSLSSAYTTQERIEANKSMQPMVVENSDDFDDMTTVTIVESAYKKFLGHEVTYTVAVYQVADGAEVTDELWKLSKSKAAAHEDLVRVGGAVILVDETTGQVLAYTPAE
ncbi:MAG: folate family ECF transporter S component [Oscillospiraceae bacterium]|nr:folate family ECF transporter S component [Oscillospiraceae bacterium]